MKTTNDSICNMSSTARTILNILKKRHRIPWGLLAILFCQKPGYIYTLLSSTWNKKSEQVISTALGCSSVKLGGLYSSFTTVAASKNTAFSPCFPWSCRPRPSKESKMANSTLFDCCAMIPRIKYIQNRTKTQASYMSSNVLRPPKMTKLLAAHPGLSRSHSKARPTGT